MPEEFMAANAGTVDVAAPEGSAAPQDTAGTPNPVAPDAGTPPTAPATTPSATPDVTQTQAFAYRLKEATEKAKAEAEAATRDTVISELSNGQYKTFLEYQESIKMQELEAKIRQQYSDVPDELIQELTESRKFREQSLSERKAAEEREAAVKAEQGKTERTNSMFSEFLTEFPEYASNEKWGSIPKEVFAEAKKWADSNGLEGRRLTDAFAKYQYNQLLKQQQTSQANQSNADRSTGSAKNNGPASPFFTREQVSVMSVAEIQKNRKAISESEKHWN